MIGRNTYILNCLHVGLLLSSVGPAAGWSWSLPQWHSWVPPSPPKCPSLSSPTHGTVTVQDKSTWSAPRVAVATYACNAGYALSGIRVRYCLNSWLLQEPSCVVPYNPDSGECPFTPDGGNCIYLNSRLNEVGWDKLTTTVTVISSRPTFINGIQVANNDIPVIKKDVAKLPTAPFRKRSVADNSDSRRRRFSHNGKTTISTRLSWNGRSLDVRREIFEVGTFTKSFWNSYIRFGLSSSGDGLAYSLHVAAHCLPDPPSRLDDVGDVKDEAISFHVALASNSRRTICLNLKDSVSCSRFALRFTAIVAHAPTGSSSITVTPDGVHAGHSGCVRVDNAGL